MKHQILTFINCLLLPGWMYAQSAVGTPTAMPPAIPIGTQTLVTVTASIPDPSLIPDSVNLLRINPNGVTPTILGSLHDDGKNGDLLAGDQLYTIQVLF